jgi:hypothetical protein
MPEAPWPVVPIRGGTSKRFLLTLTQDSIVWTQTCPAPTKKDSDFYAREFRPVASSGWR